MIALSSNAEACHPHDRAYGDSRNWQCVGCVESCRVPCIAITSCILVNYGGFV